MTVKTFRERPPEPKAPRPYHFPEVTRLELENGLRILIAENHNAPLVSVRAFAHSGADHDPSGRAGLASLTAELLDEGAGNWSAIELAEGIADLGASVYTGCDWDSSVISLDILSRNLAKGFDFFAAVVRRPALAGEELERVRSERLTTILQQKDEAEYLAAVRFNQFVFGGTPYGNPLIGTEKSVAAITIGEIGDFYRKHYVRNHLSLVITGDIAPSEAEGLARSAFSDWKRGTDVESVVMAPERAVSRRIYLVDRPEAVQSEIRIGHVGLPRKDDDYFSIVVMNAILGGVFGSRINLNLRERHGYTYGARSSFAFRRHAGPFVVGAPVRNAVTTESVTEIFRELEAIRDGEVREVELGEAKSFLAGVFPATVQTASDLANRLQDMELYGLPSDYFDRYRERIGAVTAEDVRRVANRSIDPDRAAIIIVGKASEIRPGLEALGHPISAFDVEGNLAEE